MDILEKELTETGGVVLKKKIWKIILSVLVLSILLLLCMNGITVRTKVDKTVDAIQWKLNELGALQPLKVKVKGTYSYSLWKEDKFKGEIRIESYEMTQNQLLPITFNNHMGELIYQDSERFMSLNGLGFLVCDSVFHSFCISVLQKTEDGRMEKIVL